MLPMESTRGYRLQHRHEDGSVHSMQPEHRDPAEHDPERSWEQGQIFRCESCDEKIEVIPNEES